MYLVCRTSGTLKKLQVQVDIESATLEKKIATASVN
jgi:hypothetical protein